MKIFHLDAFLRYFKQTQLNFSLFKLFFNDISNFSTLNHSLFKSDLVSKTDFYHVHGCGGRGVPYIHGHLWYISFLHLFLNTSRMFSLKFRNHSDAVRPVGLRWSLKNFFCLRLNVTCHFRFRSGVGKWDGVRGVVWVTHKIRVRLGLGVGLQNSCQNKNKMEVR